MADYIRGALRFGVDDAISGQRYADLRETVRLQKVSATAFCFAACWIYGLGFH